MQYLLQVYNSGPSMARNVTVFDPLAGWPDGVTFLGAHVQGGTGRVLVRGVLRAGVRCDLGDVPPTANQPIVILIDVFVEPDYAGTARSWTTSVSCSATDDPNGANDETGDVTTTVLRQQDVSITKTAATRRRWPAPTSSTRVDVVNDGPSTAFDVTVTDDLAAAGLEYLYTMGATCTESPDDVITCNFGDMEPGECDELRRVGADPGRLRLWRRPGRTRAEVVWDIKGDGRSIRARRATAERDGAGRLRERPARHQVRQGRGSRCEAGERVQYTIIVDNLGPSFAPSAAIKDVLSSSGEFTIENFDSDRGASCTPDNPPTGTHTSVYRFDCTLDELARDAGGRRRPEPRALDRDLRPGGQRAAGHQQHGDGDERGARSGRVEQPGPRAARDHGVGRPRDHEGRRS